MIVPHVDVCFFRLYTRVCQRCSPNACSVLQVHTDYFVQAIFVAVSSLGMLSLVLHWQMRHGALPIWLIMAYNFAWVGFGGRTMGAAYTYAHQEGHRRGGGMYRYQ